MEIISFINGSRHRGATDWALCRCPASALIIDWSHLDFAFAGLIFFALRPDLFPSIRKDPYPLLLLLWSFCGLHQKNDAFKLEPDFHLNLPRWHRTKHLAQGCAAISRLTLQRPLAATSRGQSLEGRQTCSNLTPWDTLTGLRLTRLFPSQKHVTLLKAGPDWRSV